MAIAPARNGKVKANPQLNIQTSKVACPSPPKRRVSKNARPAIPIKNKNSAAAKKPARNLQNAGRVIVVWHASLNGNAALPIGEWGVS
jgi:hypothetical protein